MEVGPPSTQWIRWWAWHCHGGALHTTQPLSRLFNARRIGRVTYRCSIPTSNGSESEPSTSGMIAASHANRRTAAADRLSP